MDDVKGLIGIRIKELRRAKNLTQEELAEGSSISAKYLSSIERGNENPTLDTFIRLADALKVEMWELFEFSQEGKSVEEIRMVIIDLILNSDAQRLKIAAKIIKALYL